MNKKQKKMLTRIIIAAVLMIAFKVINTFVDIPTVVLFIMYMVPYLVIGYDILRKAIKGILNRQVFDKFPYGSCNCRCNYNCTCR